MTENKGKHISFNVKVKASWQGDHKKTVNEYVRLIS